ncbi:unnamed protein product [Dimorphilus gyrociliatus]|uniref:Uncharacterized protein n=1 Tax=Dimorphilus gyrociliatus TaxID=2664684 RepID=A0A7I8VVN8_9ANNE|nr:unnamed protein product [Dimorphilus gyrociliatus]
MNATDSKITYEALEKKRLEKLNIPNRFSRHILDISSSPRISTSVEMYSCSPRQQPKKEQHVDPECSGDGKILKNSMAPFITGAVKSTCGYFFSRSTDNRKKDMGIPPTNPVKWRSHLGN